MAYYCRDCSYRGKVSGQAGECPACGSRNMAVNRVQTEEEAAPTKWRMAALVISWGTLIILIIGKLLS